MDGRRPRIGHVKSTIRHLFSTCGQKPTFSSYSLYIINFLFAYNSKKKWAKWAEAQKTLNLLGFLCPLLCFKSGRMPTFFGLFSLFSRPRHPSFQTKVGRAQKSGQKMSAHSRFTDLSESNPSGYLFCSFSMFICRISSREYPRASAVTARYHATSPSSSAR